MNKELRDRIKQWNEIKYGTDNGDRVVVLTSAFESYGNHTFTLGALSTAASIQSEVSTVNPAINLVHLAVYSVTLTYQDLLSNPIASHTVTGVTHDIFTESMDLFEPTTGTSIKDIFQLSSKSPHSRSSLQHLIACGYYL